MNESKDTAKGQYKAYLRDGIEQTPFYGIPYKDLVLWKGQEEADKIVSEYRRLHGDTPCVKEGLLFKSIEKIEREKNYNLV